MAEVKPGTKDPVAGTADQGELSAEEKLAKLESEAGGTDGGVEGGEKTTPTDEELENASVAKLTEFMRKEGINDIGKLVDIASELKSKNTKLDQEVRRLSAVRTFPIAGEAGAVQPGGGSQAVAADDDLVLPDPIKMVTDPTVLPNLVKKLDERADRRAALREQARTNSALQAQVNAKAAENPEEFARLQPYMFDISRRNPMILDINTVFEMAKIREKEDTDALTARVKANLGLDTIDTERIKAISTRVRQAPISGGTGVQVKQTDPEAKTKAENKTLLDAIANSDKF